MRVSASPLAKLDVETARKLIIVAGLQIKHRQATADARWSPLPYQEPPEGEWDIWLLMGGRGSGKTAAGANALDQHCRGEPCLSGKVPHRVAIIAPTHDDAVDTDLRGETGLLTLNPEIKFRPGSRLNATLTWSNGAEGELFGAFAPEDVERLRGPQHCFIWGDEFAAWRKLDEAWPMLDFGLRLGPHPRIVLTTTPKPRPKVLAIIKAEGTVVTTVTTNDNPHLPAERRAKYYAEYGGTTLGRQELDAEMLGDLPGALWTRSNIDELRRSEVPDLVRVVVAIDPAVTSDEDADETGVIVAGIDDRGEGWVLDDKSARTSPLGWARLAVGAYHDRKADRIIGEVNNGGDMVELTVRTADDRVSYKAVSASRGKRTRAEPVAALYEKGRVHHVGAFPQLEDQMCTWLPGEKSPDRMDALVWALTELMLDGSPSILDYMREQAAVQSAARAAGGTNGG